MAHRKTSKRSKARTILRLVSDPKESLLDSYRTVNDVGARIEAEQGLAESRPSFAGSLPGG
jgi:hypothetical protein